MSTSAWTFTIDEHNIGHLVFDMPGEKVNKFTEATMEELREHLQKAQSSSCQLMLIRSAKAGIFIAGADIKEIQSIKDHQQSDEKLKRGQDVFNLIAGLPFPTVAVIDGACMGGGFELALACTERWASIAPHTKMALPEVRLGVLPGWGGTQRLPQLIGLHRACDLIVTGRTIDGRKAHKLGVVNQLFAPELLDSFLKNHCERLIANPKGQLKLKRSMLDKVLDHTWLGSKLVFRKAHQNVEANGSNHYPALKTILHLLEESRQTRLETGLNMEREAFGKLITGSVAHNLVQVFFNSEAIKKSPVKTKVQGLSEDKVGIIGAGTMGGGMAWLFASKGFGVRMKDLQWNALSTAYDSIDSINASRVKRRRMGRHDANMLRTRIEATVDNSGFSNCGLVVEAVLEKMEVKKSVLSEIESHFHPSSLLCSNTSALSITEMASGLKRPEQFAGMHFFNPVHRMPLVEIIPGEQTSPETIATLFGVAKKMGKSPIIVKDVAGFLVNRILLAYMNEAARCLEDGAKVEQVDRLILDFGMPMGPFHLTDEVGIAVGYHVAHTLASAYGERMAVAKALNVIHNDMQLIGKRSGSGFYQWKGHEKQVNPEVIAQVESLGAGKTLDDKTIVERCIFTMVKEAVLCCDEGVVESPAHLDMAMILGTGFPPFRGGLVRYLDQYGCSAATDTLARLQDQWGQRFSPPEGLIDRVKHNRSFYGD